MLRIPELHTTGDWMFLKSDISAIVEMGAAGSRDVPPALVRSNELWHRIMCGNEPWEQLGKSLSQRDLELLIKGLVLLEASALSGGSVSPVIPLCRIYSGRFPAEEPQLIAWVIGNRTNEYVPFGTPRLNTARTFREHRHLVGSRDAATQSRVESDRASALARRAERRKRRATLNLPNAVRRGDVDAVRVMLADGGEWSPESAGGLSMEELAEKEGRIKLIAFLQRRSESSDSK